MDASAGHHGPIRDDPETGRALERLLRSAAAVAGLDPEQLFGELERIVDELVDGEPVSVGLQRRLTIAAYVAAAATAYAAAARGDLLGCDLLSDGLDDLEHMIASAMRLEDEILWDGDVPRRRSARRG